MPEKQYDVVILGAGLSGLSTAHFISKLNPGSEILILEKQSIPSGAIQTMQDDGFLAEWGPHGFLDNVEEGRELLDDLGLSSEALKAPLRRFLRYICLNGRLRPIPQTPPKIVTSNLLSVPKKIRLMADLWKKPLLHEQSIADWAKYRFGKGTLPFADIILTGSYAGDIDRLSIDSAMPSLRRLELESGSVIRGAVKAQKQNAGAGMPSMVSFKGGMTRLIEKLRGDVNIEFNTEIRSIDRQEGCWMINGANDSYRTKRVVLALHINQALNLISPLKKAPGMSVPEARIHNVVLGYKDNGSLPSGFGFLAPRQEKRFVLGTMFSSHMFPHRAPKGMHILEVLIGGTRNPDRLQMDDEELINQSCQDLQMLMQLPQTPEFKRVLRSQAAIPQLEIGHSKFQDYKDQMEAENQGLYICGFGWEGIGVNEMIRDAKSTAKNLVDGKPGTRERAEIKGVYV